MRKLLIIFITGLLLITGVGVAGCVSDPAPAAPVSTPEPSIAPPVYTPDPVPSDSQEPTPPASPESTPTPELISINTDMEKYLALIDEAKDIYDDYYKTRFITKSGYSVGRFWLPVPDTDPETLSMLTNQVKRYQRDNEVFAGQIRDLENRFFELPNSIKHSHSGTQFSKGIYEFRIAHNYIARSYEVYLGGDSYKVAETLFFTADKNMDWGMEYFENAYNLAIDSP